VLRTSAAEPELLEARSLFALKDGTVTADDMIASSELADSVVDGQRSEQPDRRTLPTGFVTAAHLGRALRVWPNVPHPQRLPVALRYPFGMSVPNKPSASWLRPAVKNKVFGVAPGVAGANRSPQSPSIVIGPPPGPLSSPWNSPVTGS